MCGAVIKYYLINLILVFFSHKYCETTIYNLQTFILYSGSISWPNVIELSHVAF